MLSDEDVTKHIRFIVENTDDDDAFELIGQSASILQKAIDGSGDVPENSEVALRIERFIAWMFGTIVIKPQEEPWILVSQIINNYRNPVDGMINHMPTLQGIGLAASWEGQEGQEPDWLIELDRVLVEHWYAGLMEEWEEDLKRDVMDMSIAERAACFNYLN